MKETVENLRGSVEGRGCQHWAVWVPTVDSVRAPEGFSEGKPEAAKPRVHSPQGFVAEGLPEENPKGALTLPRSTVSAPKELP